MTVINEASAYTKAVKGQVVSKAYPTLAVETKNLFVVSGGPCLVTSFVGMVTTAITVAGTTKITHDPTTGTSLDLCIATDLGTTDTPAGNMLALPSALGSSLINSIGVGLPARGDFVLAVGTLTQINATGADGGITWYLTYVPLVDGATITAAA